jgi:hypothetical protein
MLACIYKVGLMINLLEPVEEGKHYIRGKHQYKMKIGQRTCVVRFMNVRAGETGKVCAVHARGRVDSWHSHARNGPPARRRNGWRGGVKEHDCENHGGRLAMHLFFR